MLTQCRDGGDHNEVDFPFTTVVACDSVVASSQNTKQQLQMENPASQADVELM